MTPLGGPGVSDVSCPKLWALRIPCCEVQGNSRGVQP